MFATIPLSVFETLVGIGCVSVGSLLFYFGNRLFGRKTGGKRLVIFVAGIVLMIIGYFLLRMVYSRSDESVFAVLFGGFGLLSGIGFLFASFASDENVEETFKTVLRIF